MSNEKSTILVFGATGRTGRHFLALAIEKGHRVKALVRDANKLTLKDNRLAAVVGSIDTFEHYEELIDGVDLVVIMLGDAAMQNVKKVNTELVEKLVPIMRKKGVKRLLYQAGGFTRGYKQRLPLVSWILRNTLVRFSGLIGQHQDNEAVIEYLVEHATDIDWVVHRASIISDGPSKGTLIRSKTKNSLATFVDIATYNYQLAWDQTAVHSYELSCYKKI